MQNEAAANYLDDQAKIINPGGHIESQLFNCRWNSFTLEGAIKDFHSWRGEVNTWTQSFKEQADSLVKG